VVLGIGDRFFSECICLMKARSSAIHTTLPIRRFAPIASLMIGEPASLT
jgi:hypothetical protein